MNTVISLLNLGKTQMISILAELENCLSLKKKKKQPGLQHHDSGYSRNLEVYEKNEVGGGEL